MARAICRRLLHVFAFLLAFGAVPAAAQNGGPPLGHADLDALLAPIALYPDPRLSKVLIAATFSDQVQHERQATRSDARSAAQQNRAGARTETRQQHRMQTHSTAHSGPLHRGVSPRVAHSGHPGGGAHVRAGSHGGGPRR